MNKLLLTASLSTVLLLTACGEEGAGNLTVKGGIASSSAATLLEANSELDKTFGLNDFEALADSGIDPSSFPMTIYRVGFSTSADCSNLNVIEISDNPDSEDWMESPTLAQGNLPDGNYQCVAFEFLPTLSITPSETSTSGNCQNGVSFSVDVCQGGSSELLDGNADTCTTGRMAAYLSTSGSTTNEGFYPSSPSLLNSEMVVNGAQSSSFTADATGAIYDQYSTCLFNEPTWGFE